MTTKPVWKIKNNNRTDKASLNPGICSTGTNNQSVFLGSLPSNIWNQDIINSCKTHSDTGAFFTCSVKQFSVESRQQFLFALVLLYFVVIGKKKLRHFLNQWEVKTKTNHDLHVSIFRAWRQSRAIASNSDWLIALIAAVCVCDQLLNCNYFGFGCTTCSQSKAL